MAEPVPSGSGITAVILIFFYTPCYADEKFYRTRFDVCLKIGKKTYTYIYISENIFKVGINDEKEEMAHLTTYTPGNVIILLQSFVRNSISVLTSQPR